MIHAVQIYREKFKASHGHRGDGFELILKSFFESHHQLPVIIETGTARQPGNTHGDGNSTMLWDYFTGLMPNQDKGIVWSIDLDAQAVERAKKFCSDRVSFIVGDSVKELDHLSMLAHYVGLLYLDSFDLDRANPHPSALHHLKEIAAIWAKLPPRCLVAVDDCLSPECGKHIYVKDFMSHVGAELIYEGYQYVWRKLY